MDLYSLWPEVFITKNSKLEKLYKALDNSFSTHGIPNKIVHDDDLFYNAKPWRNYAIKCGFQTQETGLTNDARNVANKFEKIVETAITEGKDPHQETIENMTFFRDSPQGKNLTTPRIMMRPETEKLTIESNGTNTVKEEETLNKINRKIKMAKIIGRF